jgi:hypothetical protein
MSYFSDQQYATQQNPQSQWGAINSGMFNPAMSQAYGQGYGQVGQQFGQPNLNAFGQTSGWGGMQRQLSQQDVSDVVRQLVPLLPQILTQAQTGVGYGFGQGQRALTQQDVNEVVRQILPIVPQIASVLQGNAPTALAAMYGGPGQVGQNNLWAQNQWAQNPWLQGTFATQNPYAQSPFGQFLQHQPFGQQAWPQFQSAFGGYQSQQRTLTQNDVQEIVRQLVGIIPQAIANLQAFNQQRVI